jgi:hypothetical protein
VRQRIGEAIVDKQVEIVSCAASISELRRMELLDAGTLCHCPQAIKPGRLGPG